MKYIIYKKNQKEIIDSGSHLILDYYSENKRTCLDTSFKIQFPINQLGNLDIEIVDLNRSKNFYGTLPINKSKLSNRQFFLLKDANNKVVYNNYFSNDQSIFIESNFNKRNLYATNNNISFPLSPPPFSKSHQPIYPKKTSFSFLLPIENQKFFFRFPKEGFVFFQLDTLSDEGFTLFNFHSNYPELKDPKLLIPPLRYLSTKQEYNQLISNHYFLFLEYLLFFQIYTMILVIYLLPEMLFSLDLRRIIKMVQRVFIIITRTTMLII